jgi:uncharacterized tellurite resistance protein B-like protein
MINFFENKNKKNADESFSKIASLLIHAAKIDEEFSEKEKTIIKRALLELGADNSRIDKIMSDAIILEENSNQILDFTKEVKNVPESDKIKIIESLWKIVYSNNNADMYEKNLMRRLSGLLYIEAKTMVDIKEKIKRELIK